MQLPYRVNAQLETLSVIVLLANMIASVYFFIHFPDVVPTHWNIDGDPDGFSGKTFGAFFFPALILGIYVLLLVLPTLDPLKSRYQEFAKTYQIIRMAIVLMLSSLYWVASFAGLGAPIAINQVVPMGVGILFIVLGNFMPKVKKNWFVGIRTPWTLSNEEVWNKTHRLGGKLFVLGGLAIFVSGFLPGKIAFAILMTVVVLVSVGSMGYSLWLWKRSQ